MSGSAWSNQVQNQVIIAGTQGQLLVYQTKPGANNLIYSVSSRQFTDPYGNLVLAGATSYQHVTVNANIWVATNENLNPSDGNSVVFFTATTEAGPWTKLAVMGVAPFGPGQNVALGITTDTWNNISPFLNSWQNTPGNQIAQYQRVASPANAVAIRGVILATTATSGVFFTLPAGYRPQNGQGYAAGANGGVTAGQAPQIRCDTSGNLSVNSVATGAANSVWINGLIFLD